MLLLENEYLLDANFDSMYNFIVKGDGHCGAECDVIPVLEFAILDQLVMTPAGSFPFASHLA